MKQVVVLVSALLLALLPALAAADGEAGLVIDWGDGRVSTHCVAFQGNAVSGDQLLSRAGYNVNDFSGLVCGIGGTGCQHSGSGASCLCECPGGGADCTYWSFFTRAAGAATWQYSSLGYTQQQARQGEVHGWRWGRGGSGQAQPPPNIAFESICVPPPPPPPTSVPTATRVPPTSTPVPPAPVATRIPTSPPATVPSSGPAPTATATATETATSVPGQPTATPSATTPAEPTLADSATATALPPMTSPSPDPVSTIPPGATPTLDIPAAPATGDGDNDSISTFAVAAFGTTAMALVAAVIAGTLWRRKRGQ